MGSLDTNATTGLRVHDGAAIDVVVDDGEPFRPLDPEDVRWYLHKAVDFVADYLHSVESLPVVPDVQPGHLKKLLNPAPPSSSAPFDVAMKELRNAVVPGTTHWASPNFFAFFPATNSAAAIAGDLVASAMNTELEALALDWLAQLLRLPPSFMNHRGNAGATSEAVLVTLVAARDAALRPDARHVLQGVPANVRTIATGADTDYALDAARLRRAMQADVDAGLVPT